MTRKRVLRAAASAGAAVSICAIAFASPAWAGTNGFSSTDGSSARFSHVGDKFEVCDLMADGAAAYVDYQVVGATNRDTNPGSSGTCHTFNHDFPEMVAVSFKSCEAYPYYPDDCDGWVNRYA